jgi:hypothetical protein
MTLPALNYESPSFLTRSEIDLKLKPYTQEEVLTMIVNVKVKLNKARNRRKKVILDGLMRDLITLL